jgi:hypothetical protein
MKKLIIRLLAVILSVYLAGSIYPLFATEGGHSHGPTPSTPMPPPPPPAPPATVPSAPPQLDTKMPPLSPPPPRDIGGGGCGPEPALVGTLYEAETDRQEWRHTDFDGMADQRIGQIKGNADYLTERIRNAIKQAQDRWHQADIEVNQYQTRKNQGTLANPELLKMALEERQERWQELQHQQGRLSKVEAWRSQQTREVWALRDRAKGGDYNGFRGLRNYDTSFHPDHFK